MTATLHRHGVGLTWTEASGAARSAHALLASGRVWLVDPFEDAAALDAAAALGEPAGVVQLLDRHNRDCAAIAERLGVPHLRLPDRPPDPALAAVSVLDRPGWHEVALWWEAERTLVVAEAVGTAPAFAVGRPLGVHPLLRLTPPRAALSPHAPRRLLVGHGPPLEQGTAQALSAALAHSRSDIPRLLVSLPGLLRRGR